MTAEGFANDLALGPVSQGIMTDEGGVLLGSRAMRSESMIGFHALLNCLYGGDPYTITRKTVDDLRIEGKRLTCSTMVRNEVLTGMIDSSEARSIGFLARYLIS